MIYYRYSPDRSIKKCPAIAPSILEHTCYVHWFVHINISRQLVIDGLVYSLYKTIFENEVYY